jgi:hypothetical protein
MKRGLAIAFALVAWMGLAAAAHARTVRYHSQHPLPKKMGGGFCYIQVPHVHVFAPSDPRMFRQHDDEYYFVGDPAPFGYDGQRYSYYGPHPVVDADVDFGEPVYCYLEGPHYHAYQPTAQTSFEFRGGAYWYVGGFDPVYYQSRPRYTVINEAYRPYAYARPVVDVTVAPPEFHGTIIAGGPGVHGHAVVAAPMVSAGVHIEVPPPPSVHFGVTVGGPPTVVERERVIVAPPVRERVFVQPVEQRTVIIHERHEHEDDNDQGHHDNGRHEGWYKHGRH